MAGEWMEATLGECADWLSGGTPSKGNPEFWNGPIPWVSAKDMKTFRLHDTEDHISASAIGRGGKVVPAGSILLLVRGMTLHHDVPICVVTREMAFNQDVKALRPASSVDGAFLAYWLLANKPDLLASVELAGHGTGKLATDRLKETRINLPPLPTQRAIAHVLGTLDDLIELNRETNAILEEMARALFKSWFVDFDPVRRNKEEGGRMKDENAPSSSFLPHPSSFDHLFPDHFEDSELGEIPRGWRVASLDKVANFLNGLALQKFPPTSNPTLPVIKIAQLRKGDVLGADRCNRSIPLEYVIRDGDVLFSWSGTLAVEIWCGGEGALNQHLFKVTSENFPKWFYLSWTQHHLEWFRSIAADKAVTMGHIKRGHLSEAKVVIPSSEIIDAMTAIMNPLIEHLISNRIESRDLAALRHTLLPKLLSGEVSVPEAEEIVASAS